MTDPGAPQPPKPSGLKLTPKDDGTPKPGDGTGPKVSRHPLTFRSKSQTSSRGYPNTARWSRTRSGTRRSRTCSGTRGWRTNPQPSRHTNASRSCTGCTRSCARTRYGCSRSCALARTGTDTITSKPGKPSPPRHVADFSRTWSGQRAQAFLGSPEGRTCPATSGWTCPATSGRRTITSPGSSPSRRP